MKQFGCESELFLFKIKQNIQYLWTGMEKQHIKKAQQIINNFSTLFGHRPRRLK